MKHKRVLLLVLLLLLTCAACLPGDGDNTPEKPAGFFMGFWHGCIVPVSLVWGMFDSSIRIYETANSGWWYDLGFALALLSDVGMIAAHHKRQTHEK